MSSWVKMAGAVFEQGPDFELEKGWMSLEAAEQKLLGYGDEGGAVCVEDGGDDDNCFCVLVKKGVSKFSDKSFYSMVLKKDLIEFDGELFEDDFADTEESGYNGRWHRPGRGEGLADSHQRVCLFSSISPADCHQGAIGDCWLMSALSAMAEFPTEIEALFKPGTLAENGHYTVKLYSFESRRWQNYEIDDRLPTLNGMTDYAHITEEGEIWPCLMEKAFAMYSGNFDELEGGQPVFALGAMTGCTDLVSIQATSNDGDEWQVCQVKPTTDRVHDLGSMTVLDTVG